MKTQNRYLTGLLMSLSLAAAACGGSAPPAETPASTTEKAAPAAAPVAKAEPAPEAKAAPAPAADANSTRSGREPREILELKDNVFFFAFEESDAKTAAEAACSKQGGSDPKKVAACVSKARAEFDGDGYRFTQDKAGDWWWSVVKRKGKTLSNVHKVRYQYGDQSGNSVAIKPEGKDEGTARWSKPPAEVKFEVPTEYRIVVQDPKHGTMVYEAKNVVGD
ncbi:MAG: hypothetical protein ABW133_24995 [Polyangiaceae bacterium]